MISTDATHYGDILIAGGGIGVEVNSGSGKTNIMPTWVPYSATTMQWLRLRESGGTLYWEYAAGHHGSRALDDARPGRRSVPDDRRQAANHRRLGHDHDRHGGLRQHHHRLSLAGEAVLGPEGPPSK